MQDYEKGMRDFYTAKAMQTYGGGFVQSIGIAFTHANPVNKKKLRNAFPEYFNKYEKMGADMREAEEEKKV